MPMGEDQCADEGGRGSVQSAVNVNRYVAVPDAVQPQPKQASGTQKVAQK